MYKKFYQLLCERNVTASEVARATGIPESVFSNWKNRNGGNYKLSLDNIAKVAKYFNVPIEFFVEDEEEDE